MPQNRDWTILLIGGGSATGKSTLGESLARHFNARYIDLDLFWIVLQRAIPATSEPALHLFEPDSVWSDLEATELLERHFRAATVICKAIEPLLAYHSLVQASVIIEGVWLLPEFTLQGVYADQMLTTAPRSLYLIEPSAVEIEARIRSRFFGEWFASQPERARANGVEVQHLYGLQIKRQAEAFSLPVLESRPFDTLLDRALAALQVPERG